MQLRKEKKKGPERVFWWFQFWFFLSTVISSTFPFAHCCWFYFSFRSIFFTTVSLPKREKQRRGGRNNVNVHSFMSFYPATGRKQDPSLRTPACGANSGDSMETNSNSDSVCLKVHGLMNRLSRLRIGADDSSKPGRNKRMCSILECPGTDGCPVFCWEVNFCAGKRYHSELIYRHRVIRA